MSFEVHCFYLLGDENYDVVERLQHSLLLKRLICNKVVVSVLGVALLMGVRSRNRECQKLKFDEAPVFSLWTDVLERCSSRSYEK